MVHSRMKLIIGALIPVILLWVASHISPYDMKTLAVKDALEIIAIVAIVMEIILLVEQFALQQRFEWRENLLRSRLLNSKMMWIALPFILVFIAYLIDPNDIYGPHELRTVARVFLIAAMMAAGFDILWVVKNGLGSFGSASGAGKGIKNAGVFFGMAGKRMVLRHQDDDDHILVVGGAGSGKSSSIAIPTLAKTWGSNFLAIDIKGELAKESGRQARIFNPCNSMAYGYDPLSFR